MKKYLLPENGNFYKANLHCHSSTSDAILTPEEIKQIYLEKGYSIVAYTDHNLMIPHPELCDERFLALNGYEMDITEEKPGHFNMKKTCHICLIALDPNNIAMPFHHLSGEFLYGNGIKHADKLKYDEDTVNFEKKYTPECINKIIKIGREKGFFVTYNHPTWSLENYEQYSKYENMHAMEICNHNCITTGYADYNEKEYDDMLRLDKRIFCIGADDNHNRRASNSRDFDSFGAFTMIKADNLEYKSITDALVTGNFYASQSPEIYELWFEDGKINVTCSKADLIKLNTSNRRAVIKLDETGTGLYNASFDVLPEDGYVRITITDKNGLHANTNAYFTDELFCESSK